MRQSVKVALILSITMMCVYPTGTWGQNRRTTAGSAISAQKSDNSKSSATKTTAVQDMRNAERSSTPTTNTRKAGSSTVAEGNKNVDNRSNVNKSSGNKNADNRSTVNKNVDNRSNVNKSSSKKNSAYQYNNRVPDRKPEYERPFVDNRAMPTAHHLMGSHNYGYRINSLPGRAVIRDINNTRYYYCDGVWYKKYWLGGYVVCRPPKGQMVSSTLFTAALTVAIINNINDAAHRARYAERISTIYASENAGYIARSYDDIIKGVTDDGITYYYQDGVFYQLYRGQYYVIEPPIGALVTEIPEDYDIVRAGDMTLYRVENTLYKVTVIDGALYFEVACNL